MLGLEFEFTYPAWFLLLPLPYFIYWFAPVYKNQQVAAKVPFFALLIKALNEKPQQGAHQLKPSWWQRLILVLSWFLIVLALSKPTILGEPQTHTEIGRDVMVVLDLSGSMAEQDFTSESGNKETRLSVAKQVLKEFAENREGDRLGLILFGDSAFLQTPFTADHQVWSDLLQQTEVAMAGQSTHLGDAIGLAIKVFQNNEQKEKVVIVLTDGNDTGSFVEPVDAAKVAAVLGVRIHMIAMGDPLTVGESAIDMDTIQRVADETGGQAFEALNRDELQGAYKMINKLEPKLYDSTTFQPRTTLHYYPVIIIVLLYFIAFITVSIKRNLEKRITGKQGESDV